MKRLLFIVCAVVMAVGNLFAEDAEREIRVCPVWGNKTTTSSGWNSNTGVYGAEDAYILKKVDGYDNLYSCTMTLNTKYWNNKGDGQGTIYYYSVAYTDNLQDMGNGLVNTDLFFTNTGAVPNFTVPEDGTEVTFYATKTNEGRLRIYCDAQPVEFYVPNSNSCNTVAINPFVGEYNTTFYIEHNGGNKIEITTLGNLIWSGGSKDGQGANNKNDIGRPTGLYRATLDLATLTASITSISTEDYSTVTSINMLGAYQAYEFPALTGLNPNCIIYGNDYVTGTNVVRKSAEGTYSAISPITLSDSPNATFNNLHALTGTVSYTRDFTTQQGKYATTCLPFAPTAISSDGLTFYEYDGTTGSTINFTEATTIEANVPYIVKVGASVGSVTFEGTEMPETVITDKEIDDDSNFRGNMTYNANPVGYLLAADGSEFRPAGATSTISAFRAYIDGYTLPEEGGSHARSYAVNIDGENTTNMNNEEISTLLFNSSNGVVTINAGKSQVITIYSLSGYKVKEVELYAGANTITDLAKGFYIVNNQKFAVK